MSNLLDVPNEVLFNIVDHAQASDPYNIESLVCCCKEMMSRLRVQYEVHKKARYDSSKLVLDGFGDWRSYSGLHLANAHPIVDLKSVLMDDRVRLYVRAMKLRLSDDDDCSDDLSEVEEDVAELFASLSDDLKEQIRAKVTEVHDAICHYQPTIGAERWANCILEGDRAAAIVLLPAICTNLKRLDIKYIWVGWHSDFQDILAAMTSMAISHSTNVLGVYENLVDVSVCGVGMKYYDTNYGHMLSPFMAVPSVRNLHCREVEAKDVPWPYDNATSNLTALSFEDCEIDIETLTSHLRGVKALERFQYNFSRICDLGQTWELCRVTEALRESAAQSLTDINFGGLDFEDGQAFVGDLRPFEKLTSVRLDAIMMFEKGIPQRFLDFLPASLRCLTIMVGRRSGGLGKPELESLFEGMGSRYDRVSLTELCEICIERDWNFDHASMDNVWRSLASLCKRCSMNLKKHQRND